MTGLAWRRSNAQLMRTIGYAIRSGRILALIECTAAAVASSMHRLAAADVGFCADESACIAGLLAPSVSSWRRRGAGECASPGCESTDTSPAIAHASSCASLPPSSRAAGQADDWDCYANGMVSVCKLRLPVNIVVFPASRLRTSRWPSCVCGVCSATRRRRISFAARHRCRAKAALPRHWRGRASRCARCSPHCWKTACRCAGVEPERLLPNASSS